MTLAQPLDAAICLEQLVLRMADLHPDATATCGALEHDWIADTSGRLLRCRGALEQIGSRNERHLFASASSRARCFSPNACMVSAVGPMKGDARFRKLSRNRHFHSANHSRDESPPHQPSFAISRMVSALSGGNSHSPARDRCDNSRSPERHEAHRGRHLNRRQRKRPGARDQG